MHLESLIINHLVGDRDYYGTVIPHLKKEYFSDVSTQRIIEMFISYTEKYNRPPNYAALRVMSEKSVDGGQIHEEVFNGIIDRLNESESIEAGTDVEWLISETESHFRNQAVLNALAESIEIHERMTSGRRDRNITDIGMIPDILTKALQVTFDTSTGHDWLEDSDERFLSYIEQTDKIPFDLDILNKATNGGVERKTVNVILAGCVHPSTKIRVRYRPNEKSIRYNISLVQIGEVKDMLSHFYVEVDSPDGFVPITLFVDKGKYTEYIASTSDGRVIRCNMDHLFETDSGWKRAADMTDQQHMVLSSSGEYVEMTVICTGEQIDIVDINVDHPNHRYYTEGISSHNTNVGKSIGLVHLGRHYAMNLGLNVVYCSFEMGEHVVGKRVDAGAMKTSMDNFQLMTPKLYSAKMNAIKKKTKGTYHFKQFPTAGAHAGHIRSWLTELELKKGIRPDIIIIDYFGIMLSSRLKNSDHSYSWVKSIAEECRGLAIEYNAVMWSAAQINREGNNTMELDLNHVGESAGLSHTVDFMIALAENEDLAEQKKQVCRQLKSRYGDKNKYKSFVIGVDKDMQLWYDVNDRATPQVERDAVSKSFGGSTVLDTIEADDVKW